MSWVTPSLKELNSTCAGELSARLLDGQPLKPASVLSVLAAVRAGGEYNMYAFLAWAFKQVFMDSSEGEFLARWAEVFGVSRKPASAATGAVGVTGSPGTGLAEDAIARSQAGSFYNLSGVILPPGDGDVTAVCQATATEPGQAGNLAAGSKLNLVSPVAGLSSELIVGEGGISGGVDEEGDESLRNRLLLAIREPPHGGNAADYVSWALEVQGVENAVCFPTISGLGTVGVAIWGPPENPVLAQVVIDKAHAHILEKCPVTAGPGLTVYVPETTPIDFMIRLIPDSQNVRDSVERELRDLFDREGQPGKAIPLSHLQEAISVASGEYDHVLISPTANVEPDETSLPILGTIGFDE